MSAKESVYKMKTLYYIMKQDSDDEDQSVMTETPVVALPPEDLHMLDMVRHDFFGKSCSAAQDTLVLHLYMRQSRDVAVKFTNTSVDVTFKTIDPKFLSLNKDADEETQFCWKFNTYDKVDAEQCSFRTTASMIAITLRKIMPCRWGTFEEITEVTARIIGRRYQTMTCVPVYLPWGIVDPYEIVGHDSDRYSSVFHLIACRSDDTDVIKMLIEFNPYVLSSMVCKWRNSSSCSQT